MTEFLNRIDPWMAENPILGISVKIVGVLLLAFIVYLIMHKILVRIITKFTRRTKTEFDDILLN